MAGALRRSGLQPHVVWAALGVTIARGEEHDALWGHLGIEQADGLGGAELLARGPLSGRGRLPRACSRARARRRDRRQPDRRRSSVGSRGAVPRRRRLLVGEPGRSQAGPRFFARIVQLPGCAAERSRTWEIASTTTSCRPLAAGLVAVHVRRGPWGRLQQAPRGGARDRLALGAPRRVSLARVSRSFGAVTEETMFPPCAPFSLRTREISRFLRGGTHGSPAGPPPWAQGAWVPRTPPRSEPVSGSERNEVGMGFDAHALVEGVPLVLGGVAIE